MQDAAEAVRVQAADQGLVKPEAIERPTDHAVVAEQLTKSLAVASPFCTACASRDLERRNYGQGRHRNSM